MLLEVDEVSVSFKGKKILDKLSLTFDNDTIYCLVGKSGCGKSTLLRAMAGFQKLDSGVIRLNGKEIKGPQNGICMVHQNHANFAWLNCVDNLLMPIRAQRGKITQEDIRKAKEILEHVDLADSFTKKPFQLSGGMNQRLSIARMIMLNPELALMDEPFGALDPKTKLALEAYICAFDTQDTRGGKENMILLVTHDMEEAERIAADRTIHIGVRDTGEFKVE